MLFPPRITIQRYLGGPGRKLWDKSPDKLIEKNPDQVYVLNSTVFLRRDVVWEGDMNLSNPDDFFALKDFASSIRRNVIVARSNDVQVATNKELLLMRPLVTFLPNGQQAWDLEYANSYIFGDDNIPVYAPETLDEYFRTQRNKVTAPVPPKVVSSAYSRRVAIGDLAAQVQVTLDSPEFGLATLVRDPYTMFYDHVASELGIDPMFLHPEQVVVSVPTARKLNTLLLEFVEDEYGSDKEGAFTTARTIIKVMQPHVGMWLGIQDEYAYFFTEGNPR